VTIGAFPSFKRTSIVGQVPREKTRDMPLEGTSRFDPEFGLPEELSGREPKMGHWRSCLRRRLWMLPMCLLGKAKP